MVIGAVTAECAESHPLIEFHSRRVLFIDIDILYIQLRKRFLNQCPPYAFAEMVRMEKQHFYLAGLDTHEADDCIVIVNHPQCLNLPDGIFCLRTEVLYIVFSQKMVAGADGCFPYPEQSGYEFRGPDVFYNGYGPEAEAIGGGIHLVFVFIRGCKVRHSVEESDIAGGVGSDWKK